jgi:hypothetical protein
MRERALSFGVALAVAGSALIACAASAATATPPPPHPADVVSGSCPDVGDIVVPLDDVSIMFSVDGTPTATQPVGAATAIPVEAGVTTVRTPYADLLATAHSIVVYQSAYETQVVLVCGDIGGAGMGPADLAIGLASVNGPGYTGVATLHDNGDGSTRVSVYIVSSQVAATQEPKGSAAP